MNAAVAAAKAAQRDWDKTPAIEKAAMLHEVARRIRADEEGLSHTMCVETGKPIWEARDCIEWVAACFDYYAEIGRAARGQSLPPVARHQVNFTIKEPYGVVAAIVPFNFPLLLMSWKVAPAIMAGNTVVIKPSSASPLSAQNMLQAYIDAGVPKGVVNLVMGPGETVGQALQDHPGIDGIVFTGSYAVGMELFRTFSKTWPRPCIVEMGGKNPAIVTRKADLDEAAEGIMRSAFGFGGQKCSANSRVYVERPVHDELVRLLVEKTESIVIGDPIVRENWLGPIIDQRAVDRHQQAVSEARRDGQVLIGGERLDDGDQARGFYVEPTVVGGLPADHRVFRDEFFAPLTAVHAVDSLDEALTLANDSVYGLTAGVYSEDKNEVQQFLDRIQAGVLYVNRRAGATTGAWPGIQAFGGWKGSGSTGKAGLSMYYVAQFLREQSHTVVD